MNKPQRYTTRCTAKEKISNKVYRATFALETPTELLFQAGQCIMIYVQPGINRSMSIASPPQNKNEIMLFYDVSPMGPGSQWMLNLKVGDTMQCMAPLGVFVLDAESPRRKVLIATGTGFAPFWSMINDAVAKSKTYEMKIYWGLRHEFDIFWQEELEKFSKEHPQFSYDIILSQPQQNWPGKRGRVTHHILTTEQLPKEHEYYLCGSRAMVDEMTEQLSATGIEHHQIKKELFF